MPPMSNVLLRFRGRLIGEVELAFLRQLIAGHPELSRCGLSIKICQEWAWRQANGRLCDSVCRTLLATLDKEKLIKLPPKRCNPPNNAILHRRVRWIGPVDTSAITGRIQQLPELEFRLVRRSEGEDLFAHLLKEHHYLGYTRPVGEHLKYLILAGERPVACMAWCSAPLKLDLRDQFVGAPRASYQHRLQCIAYNSRFLIPPWVRIPSLASHLLAGIARRISHDWEQAYAHPIYLLESFVDTERFRGTCYRAANWRTLGRSQGRGTKSLAHQAICSIKEYWAYPLSANFRQQLLAPA